MRQLTDFPEGIQKLLSSVQTRPDYAERVVKLAGALRNQTKKSQQTDTVLELAMWARELDPANPKVCLLSEWALRKKVPNWHFSLVHDTRRNDVYEKALKRFVTPSTTVLEIGTGTGILAMLAARAGAKHVYTCEMEGIIADAARENITRNGFQDRITVIPKNRQN